MKKGKNSQRSDYVTAVAEYSYQKGAVSVSSGQREQAVWYLLAAISAAVSGY